MLLQRLRSAVTHLDQTRREAAQLASAVSHFDWRIQAAIYDQQLSQLLT
jgi:hypothetical protein